MSLWCYVYIAGYQVDVIHVGQWNNTPCKLLEDWMHCKAEEEKRTQWISLLDTSCREQRLLTLQQQKLLGP